MTDLTSTSPPRPPRPRRRSLIEPLTLPLPHLPAGLEGLRLCHLTDLHVRKPRRRHRQLLDEMAAIGDYDLLVLTGDYMCKPGDETDAMAVLGDVLEAAHPRLGTLGVFGNHDTREFRRLAAALPVHWLTANAPWRGDELTVLGVDCAHGSYGGDMLHTLLGEQTDTPPSSGATPWRMLLAHMPSWLPTAADAGIDLVLSGHTHGGQCRLPGARILHNGHGDWPARLSSGILRMRSTVAVVSRGLGETKLDNLRIFCPPQALLITLSADAHPPDPVARLQCLARW